MGTGGLIINGRFFKRRVSGVERYAQGLIRHLDMSYKFEQPPKWWQRGLRGHLWEQIILPLRVGGNLLWSPANSGPLAVTNQVVTICDTSVIDHPEWFNPGYAAWYRFLLPRLARKARKIFTPSDFSKNCLIKAFKLAPEKIAVIPPGVDHTHFRPASAPILAQARDQLGLPEKYLLFLSSLEPRKNLTRLFQAWRQVSAHFSDVKLVVAGGTGPAFSAQNQPIEVADTYFLGYVHEDYLAPLFSGAQAFILPSLSEGFGLPAVEAMACGTPVIASNAGALEEVISDAGLMFDPLDIGEIAHTIYKVLSDGYLRADLKEKGMKRAEKFSWQSAAASISRELQEFVPAAKDWQPWSESLE